jgi:hypothetical protein
MRNCISQGGNATISQKFMDNEKECKNSWTRRNAKIF